MLTVDALALVNDGAIIRSGFTTNSPEGIYMVDSRIGEEMTWVAKKGHGNNDWCIYIYWRDEDNVDFVINAGDKVTNKANVQKLLPCTPEALNLYRF